eukprot:13252828-Heterocapsa_arctica.AAC.1
MRSPRMPSMPAALPPLDLEKARQRAARSLTMSMWRATPAPANVGAALCAAASWSQDSTSAHSIPAKWLRTVVATSSAQDAREPSLLRRHG